MLCSVVKHLGSGRALKKWGKTLDCVSCFPLHVFRALPLPACFTTEQSTVEASLFVNLSDSHRGCLIWVKLVEIPKQKFESQLNVIYLYFIL